MKGLVLSGGKGSRLRPFTYSGAKQLVPIANIPVLHFPVRQLVESGVTEIGIVVGDTGAQVREAMGDGSRFGCRFTYIEQERPLGLAHAVAVSRGFLGDEPFVLYLGDNVLLGGITAFVEAFRRTARPAVILKAIADPRAFGVAEVSDGLLTRMVEKPLQPHSNLAVIGIYAFTTAIFDVIARQRPSTRGELEIADAINGLVAAGIPVRAEVTERYWIDTGKMEDMLAANRAVLDTLPPGVHPGARMLGAVCSGPVIVEDGAVVESSTLLGPVAIAAGARVVRSTVGPYAAIGPRAVVRESTIRDSIVMDEAFLDASPLIQESMIGRFTRVCGAPPGARLTLGDHSCLESSP